MQYQDAFFANLNLVVRIAGFLSCSEKDRWAKEKADFEQNKFYCITKGRCVITINGKPYSGKAGDCFFIPAYAKHGYYNIQDGPFEKYWFHFDIYPNSDIFRLLNLNYRISLTDDRIPNLFRELFNKYNSEKLTDMLDVKSLAINILSAFIAASDREVSVTPPDTEETLSAVLSYINQNLQQPISNTDLSALCHQHPNHFVRFFKKKTGTTPQRYITEQRVQMAKRLIEQTDMKFSDIATQAGFFDAPHLTKVFKKFYSLTPQECRKRRNIW